MICLQVHYQKLLLEKRIKDFDKMQLLAMWQNLLILKKAINYVGKAWDHVTSTTISNCWEKTGIISFQDSEPFDNGVANDTISQQEVIQNLIDKLSIDSPLSATEYISIDDNVIGNDLVTNEDIISLFSPIDEEENEENNSSSFPTILPRDAMTAFETAFNFLQQGDIEVDYNELKVFSFIETEARVT